MKSGGRKFDRFRRIAASPLGWLVGVGLALALLSGLGRIRLKIDPVDVSIRGTFVEGGSIPFGDSAPGSLRAWDSWAGSDDNLGEIVIGPFAAPERLGFFAAGYPRIGGNRLFIENVAAEEILEPDWDNFAESWAKIILPLPESWVGQPIRIHAVDPAAEWGGWLGVSAPFRVPRLATWWNGPPARLCAFLLVGVNFGVLLLGARELAQHLVGQDRFGGMMWAVGVVAAAGYGVFWLAFLHQILGVLAAWSLLVASLVVAARGRASETEGHDVLRRDWLIPAGLVVGAGVFYLATWHEFSVNSRMSHLAQYRFSSSMPADNAIPQILAGRLIDGTNLRHVMADWLSSDRPPLQAGWLLLARPIAQLMRLDLDTLAQSASLWFQLLWVPSLWFLLRALGVTLRVAAAVVVALVPAGFFVLNSIYGWPKLGGGAFMVAAYVCWFLISDAQMPRRTRFQFGGGFAALGWLSHGGVAFSMLALIPFALLSWRGTGWRAWRGAACVFLLGAIPWLAYQKFYEPPGNRLLKWHLAGTIPIDERGFGETLVDAYRAITWEEWLENRRANLSMIFVGPWHEFRSFNFARPSEWRDSQAFAFFSIGWWNLGWLAVPWVCLRSRRAWQANSRLITTLAWALLTIAIWILLMFVGGSAMVHQGSYASMMVLFALLALLLWRMHPLAFLVLAVFQAIIFTFAWASKPEHWSTANWNYDAVAVMILAFVFLVGIAWRAPDGPKKAT